jgi:hypothetical protein
VVAFDWDKTPEIWLASLYMTKFLSLNEHVFWDIVLLQRWLSIFTWPHELVLLAIR